ncbi:MAG: hypothetical protein KAI33_00980, partial [Elusimicrobiales bacterium]|nr:hypothetical protein [Elusimicrobiales bacterium]
MKKNEIKKNASLDFLNVLKKFSEKLWLDRNTASVELGAIIEEFEEDIQAETDYCEKCGNIALEKIRKNSEECEVEIVKLKAVQEDLVHQMSKFEADAEQDKERIAELKVEIGAKNEEYSKLKVSLAGKKEILDSDYSLKVTKLYEEMSRKDRGLLDKWVNKNENIKLEMADMKKKYKEKVRSLEVKEKRLETDFSAQTDRLDL